MRVIQSTTRFGATLRPLPRMIRKLQEAHHMVAEVCKDPEIRQLMNDPRTKHVTIRLDDHDGMSTRHVYVRVCTPSSESSVAVRGKNDRDRVKNSILRDLQFALKTMGQANNP